MEKVKTLSGEECSVIFMALQSKRDDIAARVQRFEGRVNERLEFADMVKCGLADLEIIDRLLKDW